MRRAGRLWRDKLTLAASAQLGPILDKPKIFKHNEYVSGKWYAWVCQFCGIVKLEDAPGPDGWICEICRIRGEFP